MNTPNQGSGLLLVAGLIIAVVFALWLFGQGVYFPAMEADHQQRQQRYQVARQTAVEQDRQGLKLTPNPTRRPTATATPR